VQQVGTPEEIYRRPANEFVATFVGQCNVLRATVVQRVGERRFRVSLAGTASSLDVLGDGLAPGAQVAVAVRPEALSLSPLEADDEPAAGANVLHGSVRAAAFLGDHYRYELDCGSMRLVGQSARPVADRRVAIHVPPEACAVIDAGGDGAVDVGAAGPVPAAASPA
jgi:ABC-type Fe3+/spermidine/putrescine transport system ATPase subunit